MPIAVCFALTVLAAGAHALALSAAVGQFAVAATLAAFVSCAGLGLARAATTPHRGARR